MKIVRPYGSSHSKGSAGALRRVLIENNPERRERDIPDFAGTHDELVIAQWISTIDKIARKPKGSKPPSPDQRVFREKLGKACWVRMTEGGRLQGAGDEKRRQFLSDVWSFKIHPYGKGTKVPRPGRDGKPPAWAEVKGRWYEVFAGDGAPEDADAAKIEKIAKRIEEHLYAREYRLGVGARPKKEGEKGRIASRAESIAGNVLRLPAAEARDNQAKWSEADKAAYVLPGDPVAAIRKNAEALKEDVSLPEAAKVLFEHWPKVFRDPETGATMNVKQAMEQHPGLFALHQQLKSATGGCSSAPARTRANTASKGS